MNLGVVVERRKSANPWQDFSWHVAAVIPGGAQVKAGTELRRDEGWIQFHGGTVPLEIFRTDTEGYKHNLSLDVPSIYVVLRERDDDQEMNVAPFLVTVNPYEAQDYMDSGEELVEAVPMPKAVIAWLADFVDRHHVDRPFKKRKRDSAKRAAEPFDHAPPRVAKNSDPSFDEKKSRRSRVGS